MSLAVKPVTGSLKVNVKTTSPEVEPGMSSVMVRTGVPRESVAKATSLMATVESVTEAVTESGPLRRDCTSAVLSVSDQRPPENVGLFVTVVYPSVTASATVPVVVRLVVPEITTPDPISPAVIKLSPAMVLMRILLADALGVPAMVSVASWAMLRAASVAVVVGRTLTVKGPPLPTFRLPLVRVEGSVEKYPLASTVMLVQSAFWVAPSRISTVRTVPAARLVRPVTLASVFLSGSCAVM